MPVMQQVSRKRPQRARKSGAAISSAGLAYMKCVTSPNDFEIDSFVGIPDEYDGRTISKRHTSVSNMATPVAAADFYIVLAPVPGVAYYTGSRATGSTASLTLTPTYYSDTATIFPTGVDRKSVV